MSFHETTAPTALPASSHEAIIENKPRTFHVDEPGAYVAIDTETPLEQEKRKIILANDGKPMDFSVIADISVTEKGETKSILLGESDGFLGLVKPGEDGQYHGISVGKGHWRNIRDSNGNTVATVSVGPTKFGENDVTVARNFSNSDVELDVVVGGESESYSSTRGDDMDIKEHKRKRKKFTKFVGGLALGYSIFHSGGAIDMAADGFNKAHDTVYEVVDPFPDYTPDTIVDGIAIKDYPDPQHMLDYFNGRNDAPEAVAQLMDDLDGHRYDDVNERAEQFLAEHPGEILSGEQQAAILDGLKNAESINEINKVLTELGDFYGVSFSASPDDPGIDVSSARNTAQGIYDGLVRLPRSLISAAALDGIKISSREHDNHDLEGGAQGYYDGDDIILFAHSRTGELTLGAATFGTPGSQDTYSVRRAFLHELGHAIHSGVGAKFVDRDVVPRQGYGLEDFDFKNLGVDVLMGGILMYPEAPSTYSRTNDHENAAENIASVIDNDRGSSLAHPDEARRFQSPANKAALKALIALEREIPGISYYLASTDDNLMGR